MIGTDSVDRERERERERERAKGIYNVCTS